jgi:hypothetical protein
VVIDKEYQFSSLALLTVMVFYEFPDDNNAHAPPPPTPQGMVVLLFLAKSQCLLHGGGELTV